MTTITNHVLRQEINKIAGGGSNIIRGGGGGGSATDSSESIDISIETKTFRKLGNYLKNIICDDGTSAMILHPMPCMKWTSRKTMTDGEVALDTPLEAVVLTVGSQSVALGYPSTDCGLSKDLELTIDLGDTEIIMNDEFYSLKAKTHAKDGVIN